jgi:small subunit ribosomal protein S20
MANHKSAEKSIRKIERRTAVNRNRLSRVRTFVKKAETLLGVSKDKFNAEEAKIALVQAESELMSGVSKGVLHKNTASRKVSRLVKRFKALVA